MELVTQYIMKHSNGKKHPVCGSQIAKAYEISGLEVRRLINVATRMPKRLSIVELVVILIHVVNRINVYIHMVWLHVAVLIIALTEKERMKI